MPFEINRDSVKGNVLAFSDNGYCISVQRISFFTGMKFDTVRFSWFEDIQKKQGNIGFGATFQIVQLKGSG